MTHRDEFIANVQSEPVIEVNPSFGLTFEQVEEKRKNGFENKTRRSVTKTYWQIICDNIFTFFNIVYFVAVALMIAAQMDITNYFFCIPVLCNMVIGLFTDIHTRHLVDKLRLVSDPKVTVVREGKEINIPANQIVLNDVIIVSAGEQISSDAVLLTGSLEMDESILTGESIKVPKKPGDTILSASYVKSGKAYCRVAAVGIANYVEGIQASAKQFKRPNSELKSSCLQIFWTTGTLAIVLGVVMTLTWIIRSLAKGNLNYDSYQNFIPSLSGSIIAMIPAGLYLLVSLALAVSVGRLAKKKMNVQELYCVEMLARVDTICFDKTGTITDGLLSVYRLDAFGDFKNDQLEKTIGAIVRETGDENLTARCLLSSFEIGHTEPDFVLPFDSDKKYALGYFKKSGTFVYGAPEFIPGEISPEEQNKLDSLTKKGFRVLGIFFSKKKTDSEELPNDLKLVGIISLTDHVKSDARKNIEWFLNNGVNVKIISGDNAATVGHIASEAGVKDADKYISMEGVSDSLIPEIVEKYNVFGRVKPEQKATIIAALQDKGHKVAMTGDGVNDILALKKADCSIAMGSGSSAARNVAHIVSVDNNFSKLPDVVAEGRRAINNLQRSASLFLAKTIFAIVLSFVFLLSQMFGGIAYPFSPKNLYIWEIITIGGAGFFLALQRTNDRVQNSFMENVLRKSIPGGIVQIAAVFITYFVALVAPDFMSYDQAKVVSTISFTILSYCLLARVSWKFDAYRGSVFGVLVAAGACLFTLDLLYGERLVGSITHDKLPPDELTSIFGLNYSSVDGYHWLFCAIMTICLIGIYALVNYLDTCCFQKSDKKEQEI